MRDYVSGAMNKTPAKSGGFSLMGHFPNSVSGRIAISDVHIQEIFHEI